MYRRPRFKKKKKGGRAHCQLSGIICHDQRTKRKRMKRNTHAQDPDAIPMFVLLFQYVGGAPRNRTFPSLSRSVITGLAAGRYLNSLEYLSDTRWA